MCLRPVLTQPNFNKPFFLQTDTSTYGVGTIVTTLQGHLITSYWEALRRSLGMTLSHRDSALFW